MSVTKGPRLLCCRYHSKKTVYDYVHACRNPLGSISFQESNQIGSVVPVPRILRPLKAYQFCTSYQMNKVVGNYNGLDSMYLSDQGHFEKRLPSIVSSRNYLTIRGRRDIQHHLRRMEQHRLLPKLVVDEMMNEAVELIDEDQFERYKDVYCRGATVISVEDALQLDKATREQRTKELSVPGMTTKVHYIPKWPSALVFVHPAACDHGCPPALVPPFAVLSCDTRFVWLLSTMICKISRLWSLVDQKVTSLMGWEGWMLSFLTQRAFPYKARKASKNNPFKRGKSMKDLLRMFEQYQSVDIGEAFEDLFRGYDDVRVCRNGLTFDEIVDRDVEVLVLINDDYGLDLPCEEEIPDGLELRWVGITRLDNDCEANRVKWDGTVWFRHGGEQHAKWWKTNRSSKNRKVNIPIKTNTRYVDQSVANDWDVAVFVRRTSNFQRLRLNQEKYLRLLGGQTKAYCKRHRYPLVSTIRRTNGSKICVCYKDEIHGSLGMVGVRNQDQCNKKAVYECPVRGCLSYICKAHHGQLKDSDHIKFLVATRPFLCGYVCLYVQEEAEEEGDNNYGQEPIVINSMDGQFDSDAASSEHDNDTDKDEDDNEQLQNHLELEPDDDGNDGDESIALENEYLEVDGAISSGPVLSDNEESSISSSVQTGPITYGVEEPGFGLNGDGTDDDEEESENEQAFPATNAGKEQVHMLLTQRASEGGVTSSYILMNTLGRCLIRRQRNINTGQAGRYFLQKQVAVATNQSLPLIYWEGMLFPNIFWSESKDSAPIGSLPSALLNDNYVLNQLGFASLMDHFRCRLTDCALLTSTDYKYQFTVWDALANIGARGNNTSVILHRGFAESQGNEGIRMRDEKEPVFDTVAIDTRPIVNKLSAAMREECCHYFFTFTANEKTMIGLRQISSYLDSEEAINNCGGQWRSNHNLKQRIYHDDEALWLALSSSSCFLKLRTWMEVSFIILRYIQYSLEVPLGEIKKLFARLELQTNNELHKAIFPHWHLILILLEALDDDGHPLHEVLDRIRGSLVDLIRVEEVQELMDQGIIKDHEDLRDVMNMAKRFLSHHCTTGRCLIPVRTDDGRNEVVFRCKAPNNRKLSRHPCDHCFIPIEVEHKEPALEVMAKIGMIEDKRNDEGMIEFVPTQAWAKVLRSEKHVPPTMCQEGIMSPTNGGMFARLRCAQNLQFTGTSDVARYLTKYIGEIDRSNKVTFSSTRQGNAIGVDFEPLHNTKISSVKIHEKEKEIRNSRTRQRPTGRALSIVEVGMGILQCPQIVTNLKFVYVPTGTMAERAVLQRKRNYFYFQDTVDMDTSDLCPILEARKTMNLSEWRMVDDFQRMTFNDCCYSPYTTDGIQLFSLRPCELTFVRHVKEYLTWFVREDRNMFKGMNAGETIECWRLELKESFRQCTWIDFFGHRVTIRRQAIPKLFDYIYQDEIREVLGDDFDEVKNLFLRLRVLNTRERIRPNTENKIIWDRFVQESSTELPIAWFRPVRPDMTDKFLIHLLLSLGSFKTEYELFENANILTCFQESKLFTCSEDSEDQEKSLNSIMEKYVRLHLLYQPGSTAAFDRQLVAAYKTLRGTLIDNDFEHSEMPSVLYSRLRDQCDENIKQFLLKSKNDIARTLHRDMVQSSIPNVPDLVSITNASCEAPMDWDLAENYPGPGQGQESFQEQSEAYRRIKAVIMKYKYTGNLSTPSICLIGAGGTGKTTVMKRALLYGMSQGLSVVVTCVLGERSNELGGNHIHKLFGFSTQHNLSPNKMAEHAIVKLLKKGQYYALLKTADIIFIDELGQVSAQMLSAMDMVMRHIRDSSRFFGGCIVMATMDVLQLQPIDGLPPVMSPLMFCNFMFFRLETSMRASNDTVHQEIQALTRLPSYRYYQAETVERLRQLLVNNCRFVSAVDALEIPLNAMFVFATHDACSRARKKVLNRMRCKYGSSFLSKDSEDWEQSLTQSLPIAATESTKCVLDNKAKEVRRLDFYPYAQYDITFNCPKSEFFQSQMAILLDQIPSNEDLMEWRPIKVMVAPPGCKEAPCVFPTRLQLINMGWKECLIGKAPSFKHHLGFRGLTAWREQYALHPRIASTCHAVMGQTLSSIVTQIDSDRNHLWESGQARVLLSRTRRAEDMFFIGDPIETVKGIVQALCRKSQFYDYINHILARLTSTEHDNASHVVVGTEQYVLDTCLMHPFRPIDTELPCPGSECCYFLVSLKNRQVTYVGRTSNLRRRINQHNSGHGSKHTHSEELRPFALVGYVSGFGSDRPACYAFEKEWQQKISYWQTQALGSLTLGDKIVIGKQMVVHWNDTNELFVLVYVVCGRID